jgi:hypothetical protein
MPKNPWIIFARSGKPQSPGDMSPRFLIWFSPLNLVGGQTFEYKKSKFRRYFSSEPLAFASSL